MWSTLVVSPCDFPAAILLSRARFVAYLVRTTVRSVLRLAYGGRRLDSPHSRRRSLFLRLFRFLFALEPRSGIEPSSDIVGVFFGACARRLRRTHRGLFRSEERRVGE